MSPENVPEHEHECKAIVSDLDDKASNIRPVDANASLRVSPLSHEGIKRPPVYFNGDSGVGSLVSNSLTSDFLILDGMTIMRHPY